MVRRGICLLLSVAIAGPASGAAHGELELARKNLDLAVQEVRGKGVPGSGVFDAGEMRPVTESLDEVIRLGSIDIAAELLLSSEQDDYARQAAANALILYDAYDLSNVDMLCEVLVNNQPHGNDDYVPADNRARVSPDTLFDGISGWIAALLEIPQQPDEDTSEEILSACFASRWEVDQFAADWAPIDPPEFHSEEMIEVTPEVPGDADTQAPREDMTDSESDKPDTAAHDEDWNS